jgi:lipoyl(octanoyl) transferase
MMHPTLVLDLEQVPYLKALAVMRGLVDWKRDATRPQVLMLLEHEAVLTMGRRSREEDFRVSRSCLIEKGIAVHRIERGGLITYHGPGQLVAYPVFDLKAMKLGVADLVDGLETVIIGCLSDFGIAGQRRENFRGVWVAGEKIASIGIAVRRGISFHGLALNAAPDLAHFDLIQPCGIAGVKMTSMVRLLRRPVDAGKLRRTMIAHFSRRFDLALSDWSWDQAQEACRATQRVSP